MYGMKSNLTKTNWLDHALQVLAAKGHGALKAEPMAKSLKVSRGSFYWHFKDVADFHNAVLEHWRLKTTQDVINMLEMQQAGGSRLKILMRIAMAADNQLEGAIRSWATHDENASKAVEWVDNARLDYIATLLKDGNLSQTQITARARFIYCAALGRMMSGAQYLDIGVNELDEIADAFCK